MRDPSRILRRPQARRVRSEAVHREIRERICLLGYPPGSRLSEDALALEFGVSRTPIRQVLHRLEFEGLVESRHGVGTFVTSIDLGLLRQIYALRMRHAELIGELDPIRPTAESLRRMREIRAQCDALLRRCDPKLFARLNMAFFQEVAALIGNRPLREAEERLYYQTARLWLHVITDVDWKDEASFFCREIEEIVAAIEAGDLTAVGLVRRNHISMSFRRFDRHLMRTAGE